MNTMINTYSQPIGAAMPEWTARPRPQRICLEGRHCRLEPLDPARHAADLYAAHSQAADGRDWTYMYAGPFSSAAGYRAFAEQAAAGNDPLHYAVIELRGGRAVGTLALMRIDPLNGVIEVGHVAFSPALRRTPASTEAQYLMMRYVFGQLGYRRYEWKCDSLNARSRQAAARLGFTFEGIFRQAIVYKGRSRDTAWFAVIDADWPARRAAFERWLAAENFDRQGRQRSPLSALDGAPGG